MPEISTELLSVVAGQPTLVNPPGLYDPSGFGYSHLAVVETPARFVYIAGQGGENEQGEIAPDFESQVEQALGNLQKALASVGADASHLAKISVFIVGHSMQRLQIYGKHFQRFLDGRKAPACTLVPVPCLALESMLFEIEATAVVPLQDL